MICVECDPDETLVSALGFARSGIRHEYGKGKACNTLKQRQGWTAMLDEDPNSAQPSYVRELAEQDTAYGMRLMEDRVRRNRFIFLCPRLEEWLVATARSESVDLTKFGLSMDARLLHEIITLRRDNLVKAVAVLGGSKRLRLLKQWLEGNNAAR